MTLKDEDVCWKVLLNKVQVNVVNYFSLGFAFGSACFLAVCVDVARC